MKINFTELSKFQRWALVSMVSEKEKKTKSEVKAWYDAIKKDGMDFKVTSSGVEFNILDVLDRLERAMEKNVEEKAKELIRDKLVDLEEFIGDVRKAIEETLEAKLNIKLEREEEV